MAATCECGRGPVVAKDMCRRCYMHEYNRRPDVMERDRIRNERPERAAQRREYNRRSYWRDPEKSREKGRSSAARWRESETNLAWMRSQARKYRTPERFAADQGRQKFTAAKADRSGRNWTPDEDCAVLDESTPCAAIASVLGRTYWAVRKRRQYLRKKGTE